MSETEVQQNRRAWLQPDGRLVSEITAGWQVDSSKYTYSIATGSFTPAATPTDMLALANPSAANPANNKLIRVIKARITGTSTSAAPFEFAFLLRSTADGTGTHTNPVPVAHDSNDPAAVATVTQWSANPATLGTLIGTIEDQNITLAGGTAVGSILDLDLPSLGKSVILRPGQFFCVNGLSGTVPGGGKFTIRLSWTEENINAGQAG